MTWWNQGTVDNIHLPSFPRRREKPNIFRTARSLQFPVQLRTENRTAGQDMSLCQLQTSQVNAIISWEAGTGGWLVERWNHGGKQGTERDQEAQTNDKSRHKISSPKIQNATAIYWLGLWRKNKKPQRGRKAQSWGHGLNQSRKKNEDLVCEETTHFLRCFVIPRSSIPNKTKSQACSRKNSEKMVALFIPLVYKTVPKKFASEAIRIAQPATHQKRREKLERKSRTTILPARKRRKH